MGSSPVTPATIGDVFAWFQPDVGGPFGTSLLADFSSAPTVIKEQYDRLGSGAKIFRADADYRNGCPHFAGKAGGSLLTLPVMRPSMGFFNQQACQVSPPPNLADWTIGLRVTARALSKWPLGTNYFSATGIGGIFSDGIWVYDTAKALKCGAGCTVDTQYCVVITKAGNSVTIYRPGATANDPAMNGAALEIGSGTNALMVGSSGNGLVFDGWIEELVVHTRPLTADEASLELGYLQDPSPVLLKSAGITLFVQPANSLGLGIAASQSLLAEVSSLLTCTRQLIELGISGQTIEEMLADIDDGTLAYVTDLAWSGSRTVMLPQEIINGLQAVQNPTTVLADFVSYCDLIRAAGALVVAPTPTGMTGEGANARYPGFETDRQTIATDMRAVPLGTHWDALADDAGDASIGPAPPITGNTWYKSEGSAPDRQCWHWFDAGQAIAANLRRTALASLGVT
jgi:hypothetical protein